MSLCARITLALAMIGLLASAYSLFHHYALRFDPDFKSFCNLNESFNCDAVALHPASEVMGVPVAAYGMASYLALMALIANGRRKPDPDVLKYSAPLMVMMCLFSIYLAAVSAWIIGSFCIVCLSIYAVNFVLLLIQVVWHKSLKSFAHSLTGFLSELRVK